jgi:hypothetical protein
MDVDAFLSRLDSHRQAGRVDDASFSRVAEHERSQKTTAPSPITISTGDGHVSSGAESKAVEEGSQFAANSLRFSLGVAAAIGATLILVGIGLLASLVDDATDLDLVIPLFALLAGFAYFAPKLKVEGRAEVFVGEARSILFGVASMVAVMWYITVVVDKSWSEDFGPLNMYEWGPTLAVAFAAVSFARKMNAWVSYCLSWILWFYPFVLAFDQNGGGEFFSVMIVMAVLSYEMVTEYLDEQRVAGSGIQATFLGMMWGIMAWFTLEEFDDLIGNDVVLPLAYIVGWMAVVEWHNRTQTSRRYPSGQNKGWITTLLLLVFYTGIPLWFGFAFADFIGWEELNIAGFDVYLGFVFGLLVHAIMGLQLFGWQAQNVVVKPSLSEPGPFAGSVFFLMAFVWFIFGAVDFLEDLAGYLFLPLGLLVLLIGTKRLIGSSDSSPEKDGQLVDLSKES